MNEITKTLIAQLGGSQLFAMTGATALYDHEESTGNVTITFNLPAVSKVSALLVHYSAALDTYTIETYKGRGVRMQKSGQPLFGLHAEQLRPAFESLTGLRTSL